MATKPVKLPDINFAEELDTSNLRAFSIDEVKALLSRLPKTKYVYGAEVVEAGKMLDEKRFELKRATALAHIDASTNKEKLGLSSAEDQKAHAINDQSVIDAEVAVVEASGAYEYAKLQFGYVDDLFIAARKVATIVEKQMEAEAEATRYGNAN